MDLTRARVLKGKYNERRDRCKDRRYPCSYNSRNGHYNINPVRREVRTSEDNAQ